MWMSVPQPGMRTPDVTPCSFGSGVFTASSVLAALILVLSATPASARTTVGATLVEGAGFRTYVREGAPETERSSGIWGN